MKALFDTSVLVAAAVGTHARHAAAFGWLQRAREGAVEGFVAGHTLAELYAVLTRLPVHPPLSTLVVLKIVEEDAAKILSVVTLSAEDIRRTLRRLADLCVSGGAVYDALIARAAEKAGVDRLLTLNRPDFRRVWPEGGARIIEP